MPRGKQTIFSETVEAQTVNHNNLSSLENRVHLPRYQLNTYSKTKAHLKNQMKLLLIQVLVSVYYCIYKQCKLMKAKFASTNLV